MIGKYLVNEQYILETSHWLITSPYEHEMTVNFINPASAVEVNQNGILFQPLRSNQMQSWFGRWGSERVKPSTNTCLLYAETGRFLLYVAIYRQIIKYWLKLTCTSDHRYIAIAFHESPSEWSLFVKKIAI